MRGTALGRRAEERVERAATMRSNVLFPALRQLAVGETVPADNLDARIDERFFDSLFSSLDAGDESARAAWDDELVQLATAELNAAIDGAALSDARFWRATTAARRMFHGCLKKRFPDASERLRTSHAADAAPAERTAP